MDGWHDLSESEQLAYRDEGRSEGMNGYQWYRHCEAADRKQRKRGQLATKGQKAFRPDLEHELAASED